MLAKVSMHRWPEAFLPLEMRAGTLTCSCGHPVRTSESGLRNPQRVLRQGHAAEETREAERGSQHHKLDTVLVVRDTGLPRGPA